MTVTSTCSWHHIEDPRRLCSAQVLASAEDFARGRCVALIENHGWGWLAGALPPAADSAEGLIRSFLGNDVATAKTWCERTCRLHDRDPSAFTQPGFSPNLMKTSLSVSAEDQFTSATRDTGPSGQFGHSGKCRQAGDNSQHGNPSTIDGQIRAALAADCSQSDRAIARAVRCSPSSVGKTRRSMGLSGAERSVQRGGQMYSMRAPVAGAAP